uniref:Uncharacterized protein n=1 Tax=Solanum tuberosum TaxID=4113 RepID=M1DJN9_SOLTU
MPQKNTDFPFCKTQKTVDPSPTSALHPAARDPQSITLMDQCDAPSIDTSTISDLPSAAAVSVVPSRAFVKVDPISCKIVRLDPSTTESVPPYNPTLKLNPSYLINLTPPPPLYPPQKFVYEDIDPRGTNLSVPFEKLRTDPLIH